MKSSPFLVESPKGGSHYTHLFARISEEDGDDGFTVQIKLYNKVTPGNAAWGEEMADCLETASMLVAALAAEFSIPTECIEIELRMHKPEDGTRH
jgi:hypothetical protein